MYKTISCARRRAAVQWVSQQPDTISLMFMYACHIQPKTCVGFTLLKNGARPTARGCKGYILAAHAGDNKIWVGILSSLKTWDLGRRIFMYAPYPYTQGSYCK